MVNKRINCIDTSLYYSHYFSMNKDISKLIFDISKGSFYLVYLGIVTGPRDEEWIEEMLEDIFDVSLNNKAIKDYYDDEGFVVLNKYFKKNFKPNFKILLQSLDVGYNAHGESFQDIMEIYDVETLDFFLSFSSFLDGTTCHIVSKDYDLNFLDKAWSIFFQKIFWNKEVEIEIYENRNRDEKAYLSHLNNVIFNDIKINTKKVRPMFSYEFFCIKHRDYISFKKFMFYDATFDEEGLFFISSNKELSNIMISKYCAIQSSKTIKI